MNFKKKQDIFFGNSCSRDFGATDCYPSTLIDLANTAVLVEIQERPYARFARATESIEVSLVRWISKVGRFFLGKLCSRGFWGPWLPSKHFN